jgi:hypothetical protein
MVRPVAGTGGAKLQTSLRIRVRHVRARSVLVGWVGLAVVVEGARVLPWQQRLLVVRVVPGSASCGE